MRKLAVAALAVLVSGCAAKGLVSNENQVVVQALTESKAVRFAERECERYGRTAVLTESSLRTYMFDCRTDNMPAQVIPPPPPPQAQQVVVKEIPRATRPPPPPGAKLRAAPPPPPPQAAQPAPKPLRPPPPPQKAAPAPPPPPPQKQAAAHPLKREPQAVSVKSGWWVQVSADRTRGEAEATGRRVKKKFATLLKKRSYRIEKVTVRDAGIYYRSRFGPYPSRAAAARACSAMKKSRQGCIIAR